MKKHQRLGLGILLFILIIATMFTGKPELTEGLWFATNITALIGTFIGCILLGSD